MASKALSLVQKFYPHVSRIKDTTKAVMIQVSDADVKASQKGKHSQCAMATACKRSLGVDQAVISQSVAYLVKGKTATRFLVGEHLSREIVAFDRGGSFSAGEYRLEKPSVGNALGVSKPKAKPTQDPGSRGERKRRYVTTNVRAWLAKASA